MRPAQLDNLRDAIVLVPDFLWWKVSLPHNPVEIFVIDRGLVRTIGSLSYYPFDYPLYWRWQCHFTSNLLQFHQIYWSLDSTIRSFESSSIILFRSLHCSFQVTISSSLFCKIIFDRYLLYQLTFYLHTSTKHLHYYTSSLLQQSYFFISFNQTSSW